MLFRSRTAGNYREFNPEKLLELSIHGMLPKNTLGRKQGLNLHVYAGAEHAHAAQQPEALDINKLV